MDYNYDYTTRIADPAYVVEVGCERDTMRDAQQMMYTLGVKGIATVGRLHVIIDGMQAGIPAITRVEFDSEESYAWFLLRWS